MLELGWTNRKWTDIRVVRSFWGSCGSGCLPPCIQGFVVKADNVEDLIKRLTEQLKLKIGEKWVWDGWLILFPNGDLRYGLLLDEAKTFLSNDNLGQLKQGFMLTFTAAPVSFFLFPLRFSLALPMYYRMLRPHWAELSGSFRFRTTVESCGRQAAARNKPGRCSWTSRHASSARFVRAAPYS